MNKITFALPAILALALAGCAVFNNAANAAKSELEKQLKICVADKLNKLAERMDAKPKEPSVVPDPAKPVEGLPPFVWKYGDFNPQPPVAVWWGKLKNATPNRVEMDYAGCPAWFAEALTDDNMFEVCAFWEDGAMFVGGKFDWINLIRKIRDLAHTNKPGELYRNWDGRYAERPPDHIVIVNTKLREWMIFTAP